jgi:hypothetical protein
MVASVWITSKSSHTSHTVVVIDLCGNGVVEGVITIGGKTMSRNYWTKEEIVKGGMNG